jgi:hypothetical protein
VYVIALDNTGTAPRTGEIWLDEPTSKLLCTVTQNGNSGGDVTVTVTPDNIQMPFGTSMYPAQVNCKRSNGADAPDYPWTLTSPAPDWLRLSLSPNASFDTATPSVSGTGPQPVYIYVLNNEAGSPRTAGIYAGNSSSNVVATVTQSRSFGNITDNDGAGNAPQNTVTYVGAFWRANQTGERVIRIDMRGNNANLGAWTVQVMWMDGRWRGNDIVLSTNNLPGKAGSDPGIYSQYPGNAENYQVDGNNMIITGDVVNGFVNFRIGLKSQYTPTANRPARYAVLLFSFANNTKHQKIYLRQGDEADYLMHPNDPVVISGVMAVNRPAAKMVSPYNLTVTELNVQASVRGGKFVDYPTQAGAFFQWANNYTGTQFPGGIRWAWDPHRAASEVTWNQAFSTNFWHMLSPDHEVCPPGFRRMNDGSTTGYVSSPTAFNSELRQSLFQTPLSGVNYASTTHNSVWGYYADGFFDRRGIENSVNLVGNTAVSYGNRDCAYIGRLFFNPLLNSDRYQASLFFPAGGSRYYTTGDLLLTGSEAQYWTSSAHLSSTGNSNAMGLRIWSTHAGPWAFDKKFALSLRPVKE